MPPAGAASSAPALACHRKPRLLLEAGAAMPAGGITVASRLGVGRIRRRRDVGRAGHASLTPVQAGGSLAGKDSRLASSTGSGRGLLSLLATHGHTRAMAPLRSDRSWSA